MKNVKLIVGGVEINSVENGYKESDLICNSEFKSPSLGAFRAARKLIETDSDIVMFSAAREIDAETGLPELIQSLQSAVEYIRANDNGITPCPKASEIVKQAREILAKHSD